MKLGSPAIIINSDLRVGEMVMEWPRSSGSS